MKGKTFYTDRTRGSYLRYTLKHRTNKILSLLEQFLEKKGNKYPKKILDIGCADGLMTEEIIKHLRHNFVLGIERNTNFILPPKMNKASYLYGDGCILPMKDEVFDAIIVSACFKHIPNPKEFSQEMLRVLKRNGIVIICEPRPYVLKFGVWVGKFQKRWLFNVWSLKEYQGFLANIGFRTLYSTYYMPPIPLGNNLESFLKKFRIHLFFLHQVGIFQK